MALLKFLRSLQGQKFRTVTINDRFYATVLRLIEERFSSGPVRVEGVERSGTIYLIRIRTSDTKTRTIEFDLQPLLQHAGLGNDD